MKLIQIIFLAGSHCVSPVEHMQGLSEVSKVPCAVIVNRDTETNAVTTEPPGLAALPEVAVAIGPAPESAKPHPFFVEAKPQSPRIRIIPASDNAIPHEAKPASKKARVAALPATPKKRRLAKALPDRCGSYKAVWYTTKSGSKRYKCVRQG